MCLYNRCMITEITNDNYTTQEKLQILADAAKYDVACTSSGSSRRGKKGELGNAEACGICHSANFTTLSSMDGQYLGPVPSMIPA